MHEATVAEAILSLVLRSIPEEVVRVKRVNLVVGAFGGVEKESLDLYFNALSQGTKAEGATLVMTVKPAKLTCRSCGELSFYDGREKLRETCLKCGGPNRVEKEKLFYIDNIEVENEN
ncbi:MAG: hydrogenase maturation nickel metallochaperone HypA [Candidatus Margulisiibacteriota bacterium]|jgi:hydrogenase nickel incorporation protein HypA/HybF